MGGDGRETPCWGLRPSFSEDESRSLGRGAEGLGPAFPGWQGQLDLRRHDGEEAMGNEM